ncbi:MAG: phosphate regulon sensor protein PhoR [marine bacterium B5-7]|nr:MAG: phosphate regulon sensor protein PhoR [marine bacterium B5-7]
MPQPDNTLVEIALVALIALILVVVGIVTNTGAIPVAVGLATYISWLFFQLYRFRNWIAHPKREPAPYRVGIWDPLTSETTEIRNRGKSRKKRLRNILGGFQESTHALPDATVVLDENWMVEWANSVASQLLGIGKNREQALGIHDYIDDLVFHAYIEGGDYTRPLQIPAPVDYSISLEIRVVPYGKGKHLIQARDITRLNQLENVRRDFVANASHELRTPLTVVHGYMETILDADDDDDLEQWKPILTQVYRQSTRLKGIVEDLLTLSRLETRDRSEGQEIVNIAQMIERIVDGADSVSGDPGHDISAEVTATLGLNANASEIESAFSNLVYNAVRYTPENGRINLHWWLSGDEPCFSVMDTGVGIEAHHIPRLTERFYRVDVGRSRDKGGTGLGLAIVKHVLIRHGARLKIDSEPGHGSTFTCIFPKDRAEIVPLDDFVEVDSAQSIIK